MTQKTKLLLGFSIASFALGFTDLYWGVGKPIGAILFGLFLISKMLEKEAALFDQEQATHEALAEKAATRSAGPIKADLAARATAATRS